jgi:hypothetical protein
MGLEHSPTIVTNGLVYYLDAANSRCYSGSGITVSSLVGGIGGTLVNGVGFTSTNNGSIVFDGTNDFITVPSITSISGDLSVLIWFRTSGLNVSAARLIEFDYINGFWLGQAATGTPSTNWGGGIKEANGPYGIFLQFSDNEWNLISSVRSSTTHFLYKNNLVSSTSNNVSGTSLSSTAGMYICAADNVGSVPFNGRIGQILIYNRALTQQEILQLYNATKGRYGL